MNGNSQSAAKIRLSARDISARLAARAADIAATLLPEGKLSKVSGESVWQVGSVNGEKGRSMVVYLSGDRQGRFHDFENGDDGDMLDLLRIRGGAGTSEAMKEAATLLGISLEAPAAKQQQPKAAKQQPATHVRPTIPAKAQPATAGPIAEWLKARGFTAATIEAFDVHADGDMVIWPYRRDGELINVKRRSITDKRQTTQFTGAEPCALGWDLVPDDARWICIAEGEPDAMALYQLGFLAITGNAGAGNHKWVKSDRKRLDRFERIYLCYDNDPAGRRGRAEVAELLRPDRCWIVTFPFKDANEYLLNGATPADIQWNLDHARAATGLNGHDRALTDAPAAGDDKSAPIDRRNGIDAHDLAPAKILADRRPDQGDPRFDGEMDVEARTDTSWEFLDLLELSERPATAWRVAGLIPERGLVVVYGQSGSGKTFAVLDMGFAIARWQPWAGRRTSHGTVAYIAAEGHIWPRAKAYLKHHKLELGSIPRLRILQRSINLLHGDDETSLIASLSRLARKTDGIEVVVIDTLSRSIPGGNENAPEDMGRVIAVARRIEDAFGCVVIFIHHSGKDETRGSRGHSSLKAATDAELSVQRDKNDPDRRSVTLEKLRDGADGETALQFRLLSVDLGPMTAIDPGANPDERQTSCVVEPVAQAQALPARRPDPKGSNQRIVLRILRELIADSGELLPASSVMPTGKRGAKVVSLVERAESKMNAPTVARRRERVGEALSGLIGNQFADRHSEWVWLC